MSAGRAERRLAALLLVAAAGCAAGGPAPAERLGVEVVAVWPHDPEAYTQGLVWAEGDLFESTGRYGRSKLRRVDLESGRVEAEASLADDLFGEGLARVGERLVQLTWREGRALVWSLSDLAPLAERRYAGEGWGLCHDGERLFMSDGSADLTVRDPTTFAEVERLRVTLDGRPLPRLNELECAEGWVWANVWQREWIVRIDPLGGRVTAVVDASGLLADEERRRADVLNGIAHAPERGTWLVTGKLWPKVFEVVFRQPTSRSGERGTR